MAGWLFSLGNEEDLEKCFKRGYYSTNIKIDSKNPIAFEGTFADFS